jgi:hypothetical protein
MSLPKPVVVLAPLLGLLAIGTGVKLLAPRTAPLEVYQDFEKRLNDIVDPREARSEEQLQAIRESLAQLTVPTKYQAEWATSEAVQRYRAWSADAEALAKAVAAVRQGYQKITVEGRRVLADKDAADLPGRAREVLQMAKDLPDSSLERARLIPGSQRISYATVFEFPSIPEARTAWEAVRKELEPLAELAKP